MSVSLISPCIGTKIIKTKKNKLRSHTMIIVIEIT